MLVAELIAFKLIGEWTQLYIYDKTEVMLKKKGLLLSAVIIGGIFLAYALPLLGATIDFKLILFNLYVMISIFGFGVVAFINLWKYRRYSRIAKDLLTKDNLFNKEA